MRFTAILFSSLFLLFGSYDTSRGSELQRASAAYKEGDYYTALQTFIPLAEKGDMIAQFNLAKMYREGKGVPKDYKTAVKWFSLSAEQGNAKAQYHLGVAHSFGLGVVPDYKIALKWFNRSAEQGNTFSQYHLFRPKQMILRKSITLFRGPIKPFQCNFIVRYYAESKTVCHP